MIDITGKSLEKENKKKGSTKKDTKQPPEKEPPDATKTVTDKSSKPAEETKPKS